MKCKKKVKVVNVVEKLMKQKELILTIGIIGRNNEDTIEKCLKSIMPLRNAIKSEIIYTDTGSTDETISIASKYADHIINFEWCGDFAAARNTAVEASRGVWFMWIDTDEYFDESISELIEFFTSGEHKTYMSGIINIKNIFSFKSDSDMGIISIHRLSVLADINTKFLYRIHEGILPQKPFKNLETQLIHTGYVSDDKEKVKDKQKRNIDLLKQEISELKELEKLRAIYHLLKSYSVLEDFINLENVSNQGIDEYKREPNLINSEYGNIYYNSFLIFKSIAFMNTSRENNAVEILNEIEISTPKIEFMNCDKYYILYWASGSVNNTDMKLENAIKFVECSSLLKTNCLNKENIAVYNLISDKPSNRFDACVFLAGHYIEVNDRQKFEKYMALIENRELPCLNKFFAREYFKMVMLSAESFEKPEIVALKYGMFADEEKMATQMQIAIENHLPESRYKNEISRMISELNIEDSYIRLNRVRNAAYLGDIEIVKLNLDELIKDDTLASEGIYYDVLYYAYAYHISIIPKLLRLYSRNLENNIRLAAQNHTDFFEIVKTYLKNGFNDSISISEKYLNLKVIEAILNDSNSEEVISIINDIVPSYISAVYAAEILSDENVIVLPNIMQFGYHLNRADNFKRNNDMASYLRELKKAIICYPVMKKPVEKLLKVVSEELEKQDAEQNEFAELAKQVKINIYQLMKEAKYDEALGIIAQLSTLVPNDKELEEIKKQILKI